MAAAQSIGRASAVEAPPAAREAELTGALYERYSGQIYGFCLHKLGSREEAEDAVQTTFLNAFRGLARGIEPQAESAWLFKIAENVCLSRHRSSFRRRRVESPSDLEALQDVVPGHEPQKDELHGLERVLERMPDTQRRAILLREWQGLSYREIADEMGITQPAVETLIFRARRALAQGLESVEHEPLRRRRVRRSIDAGSVAATLKTFFGSAAAMKTAATVVAVTSATVVAATPAHHRHRPRPAQAPAATKRAARVVASAPAAVAPAVAQRSAPAPVVVVPQAHRPVLVAQPVRSVAHRPTPVAVAPAASAEPAVSPPAAAPPAPVEPQAPASEPSAAAPQQSAAPPAPVPPGPSETPSGTASDQGSAKSLPPARRMEGAGDGRKDRRRGGSGPTQRKGHERTSAGVQPPQLPETPTDALPPADAPPADPVPPASTDNSAAQQTGPTSSSQPASGGGAYPPGGTLRSPTNRADQG